MLKPWSISTAARNPGRLRGFLSVLSDMEGEKWNHDTQAKFQIKLIQARVYGAYNSQFYNGLLRKHIDLIESGQEISYTQARIIFEYKDYEDPAMRGRVSVKPLERFGLASVKGGKICITGMGKLLLAETKDYGEIFLRGLLKWQFPNPLDKDFPAEEGYNIKPFVGVLRLINAVNRLSAQQKGKEKGLSFDEFRIFALTLINWRDIDKTAKSIIEFRQKLAGISANKKHALIEKEVARLSKNFNMQHVQDYADNAIRYFRMTKYIRLRGWGYHIDLEPARINELTALFKRDNAAAINDFTNLGGNYADYLASATMPDLPGETIPELKATIKLIASEIRKISGEQKEIERAKTILEKESSHPQLIQYRSDLRNRQQILIRSVNKSEILNPDKAAKCIEDLRLLSTQKQKGTMPPSVKLEWLATRALDILNDAEEIRPNYPVGDDGVPTHTASGGMADIECDYGSFAAICEVTMLRDSKQWMHEAQPVMRHLLEFGKKHESKEVYCLFIAPKMHRDSLNIFHYSAASGYEGHKQRIVPLTILQFCDILDFCIERIRIQKNLKKANVKMLFDSLADSVCNIKETNKWEEGVPTLIDAWKQNA